MMKSVSSSSCRISLLFWTLLLLPSILKRAKENRGGGGGIVFVQAFRQGPSFWNHRVLKNGPESSLLLLLSPSTSFVLGKRHDTTSTRMCAVAGSTLVETTTTKNTIPNTRNDSPDDDDRISVDRPMHICIAGAGVGGLALANGLGDCPHMKVTIVEQTAQFKRFGGPIQLASNALAIIQEMDPELYRNVLDKFTFTGDKRNGIKDGIRTEWYAEFDLKSPAEQRNMPYSGVIDRPDLQDLYLQQILQKNQTITLQQGNGLVSYEQQHHYQPSSSFDNNQNGDKQEGNVVIQLEQGDTITADVLIGADGIWSKVRQKLYQQKSAKGEGSGAVYSGYTVYAGELTYTAPDHNLVGYKVYIGPGQYFVITDIGKGKYQWYAFLARPPNSSAKQQSTATLNTTTTTTTIASSLTKDGDDSTAVSATSQYLQQIFTNWSPEIHDILKATAEHEIEQRDLYDRKPSRPWCKGNVALLGDGIHAMPNLGQGGCQAMEDAYVLNQELQKITHRSQVKDALLKYQQRRWIRASAVQGLSRFASDIIIRGFDTPAKIYWNENGLQLENCNYAGIVTRLLQPFLPIFFSVQFNYLYDGYRNDKTIDIPATIGFTLLGGLIASLLSIEVVEAGLATRWGLGALVGTEGAIEEGAQLPDISQWLPIDWSHLLDKFW